MLILHTLLVVLAVCLRSTLLKVFQTLVLLRAHLLGSRNCTTHARVSRSYSALSRRQNFSLHETDIAAVQPPVPLTFVTLLGIHIPAPVARPTGTVVSTGITAAQAPTLVTPCKKTRMCVTLLTLPDTKKRFLTAEGGQNIRSRIFSSVEPCTRCADRCAIVPEEELTSGNGCGREHLQSTK